MEGLLLHFIYSLSCTKLISILKKNEQTVSLVNYNHFIRLYTAMLYIASICCYVSVQHENSNNVSSQYFTDIVKFNVVSTFTSFMYQTKPFRKTVDTIVRSAHLNAKSFHCV